MMFLGSLVLAYSVEQSGLHKRLAYFAIQLIGYSHLKLLLAMCCVTTFASMWITNTAATTMMVPINFAVLKVFEDQKVIKVFEKNSDGDLVASDTTACYFCAATFSATVGGIGTLVGTGTNLVFKGLFMQSYLEAPEYLSFPKFSFFAVPFMIVLETFVYLYMAVTYFGFLSIRDSALAMFVGFLMLLLPRTLSFFSNFTVKYKEDMPKGKALSVLDWGLLNTQMPFAFSFLLVVVVVLVTNFASNVAVCNVFTPIAMQLIVAGFGPTLSTMALTWIAMNTYAPIIWPDLREMPDWIAAAKVEE
ncbi:hypothetical protein HF086_001748 [Spodoptera exigua]|uniref:Citrate transporter-like domain-containing protein n=1 Tax=Spodoptera exigua TaxID=7107 RepID=A0A922M023_SPOEX|nr:hypothetical protein HF086_001748 [Spodoptera exigua]